MDLLSNTALCPQSSQPEASNSSEVKPPYSYVAMISMAIRDSPNKKLTLAQVISQSECVIWVT